MFYDDCGCHNLNEKMVKPERQEFNQNKSKISPLARKLGALIQLRIGDAITPSFEILCRVNGSTDV